MIPQKNTCPDSAIRPGQVFFVCLKQNNYLIDFHRIIVYNAIMR